MKKLLPVLLLFAALALALPALAEPGDGSLGDMVVVNCSEWVSLRAQPDAAREYGRVKEEGASLHPHDIDGYIEHKSAFIERIYTELGL